MLTVKTSEQARDTLRAAFGTYRTRTETICLHNACGRTLALNLTAEENIPPFDRSMVDGYAVRAADTFGCSESTPAMLRLAGKAEMGEAQGHSIRAGECFYVPTGGALPLGADAMVMIEYAEDCGDGFIFLQRPSAPGMHVIFAGDDFRMGNFVLTAGTRLRAQEIGVLAALGQGMVSVYRRPVVGILSTGNELVTVDETPVGSQIRDVNNSVLAACVERAGGEALRCAIARDDEQALLKAARAALASCDLLLISGGSSAGEQDMTRRVIEQLHDSALLFHGLAVKPGKPTIAAAAGGKPVFGLPGHPVSAYMIFEVFVRPLICSLLGRSDESYPVAAMLTQSIPSNHGREEFVAVKLARTADGLLATPVSGKSGLISTLSKADGCLCIPRECEGLTENMTVQVYLF